MTSPTDPRETPIVWLMMGHKAGDNSQVLAMAEALEWPFEIKRFVYQKYEIIPNFTFGPTLKGIVPEKSSRLEPPWPDLILSAGRRNEPICRWIQNRAKPEKHVRMVHIGRPWARIERFDLIVTTPQYRLPDKPNVLHNKTPLHRITDERLAEAAAEWAPRFAELARPYVAVVIGGSSGPYGYDQEAAARLGRMAGERARALGGSVLATTSARTPAATHDTFQRALEVPNHLFRWRADAPENPYFGMLGLADEIIVTGDSMSMLTEACATGKPVHIFDIGVGKKAMRPETAAAARASEGPDRPEWAHIQAFFYRLMMNHGPQRLSRDIRLVHKLLVENGHAVWLGDPFPDDRPPPPIDSVPLAVARIKALFEQPAPRC
ncbi:mitochondrial fission ELM1 family protein [Oceanibacterium hippocampi]|uniref:Nucleoside-diphosphate sugar epimerase n=1 Tax=Oceanibacterium hippocampi TaxID=745714 RepID=A0A1Y5TYY6_9PROT|nr:mitochondrial fission ELM1 family protein [Oceanibacterium hippocampi]SLN76235.1 hypothetical protein OCH7691_04072 [Oceanibacterium hippocampi]